MELPYLSTPVLTHPSGRVVIGHEQEHDVPGWWVSILDRILYDAPNLSELSRWVSACTPGRTPRTAARRLRSAARLADNVLRILDLRLPARFDAILLCQGYGGVYVHTIDLWKRLNETHRALLISPVEPLYGHPEELDERLVVLERIRKNIPEFSYFSWIQIVRAILRAVSHDLLYIEHRSQSLYTFDLLSCARRGSIIHDDGFHDPVYFGSKAARIRNTEQRRRRILAEIYHSARFNIPTYYGLHGTPQNNRRMMEAGWLAMRSAAENWHWSLPNHAMMSSYYSRASTKFRFVLPFVDTRLRKEGLEYDPRRVLFTTTMHNIVKKGIVELCRALRHVPKSIRAYCVLGQPDQLPERIRAHATGLIMMGRQSKSKLVELYHRSAVYCRVSRDESSPLSMMEAMACGLPIITSPTVQANLPILQDGVTGFIVSPRDPPQVLADRIMRICRDRELRARMSKACMERVAAHDMGAKLGLLGKYMRGHVGT
jgi:glycosyltransferase involved in cell wall biosynthesis